jgi:hypothetical protein
MIAARGRDHARRRYNIAQDAIKGPTRLERAGMLKLFQLHYHVGIDAPKTGFQV